MLSLKELWAGLCVIGMTAAVGVTLTALTVRLVDWPADPPAPAPDRAAQWSREERDRLEAELLRERAAHQATLVELDRVRRGAIWFPRREDQVADGDRIPPQVLPVVPAGHQEE